LYAKFVEFLSAALTVRPEGVTSVFDKVTTVTTYEL